MQTCNKLGIIIVDVAHATFEVARQNREDCDPPYRRFERFPAIVQLLKRRGFSNENVVKITGENFMRLFAAVVTPA